MCERVHRGTPLCTDRQDSAVEKAGAVLTHGALGGEAEVFRQVDDAVLAEGLALSPVRRIRRSKAGHSVCWWR